MEYIIKIINVFIKNICIWMFCYGDIKGRVNCMKYVYFSYYFNFLVVVG